MVWKRRITRQRKVPVIWLLLEAYAADVSRRPASSGVPTSVLRRSATLAKEDLPTATRQPVTVTVVRVYFTVYTNRPHNHGELILWPRHVQNAPSLSVLRRELKTVLFRSSFPDVIWQCTVLYLRARHSVLICHHVLAATNWFYSHCTVVLQQQCDNAT